MRIAFLNRQREAFPGGDLVQIDETISALKHRGVYAEYAPEGWDRAWLTSFDLAHVVHCNFGWSKYNVGRCIEFDVPYVMTPMFYPTDQLGASRDDITDMLYNAKRVLPFSTRERDEIQRFVTYYGVDDLTIPFHHQPIPNGTSRDFHCHRDSIGVRFARHGVLCVSARGPSDKNVALVERVCKRVGLPFTCLWDVGREVLPAAYKTAWIFVNASGSERMSLTIGEALCAGCRVIATAANWGNGWYGDGLVKFEPPQTPQDVEEAERQLELLIGWAATSRQWDYSPNEIARTLTWDHVARSLIAVYEEVL